MVLRVWTVSVLVSVFSVTCVVVTTGDPVETNCDVGKAEGLLDAAVDLFKKARETLSNGYSRTSEQLCRQLPIQCPVVPLPQLSRLPRDCFELMSNGTKTSGVYRILPDHRMFYGTDGFDVYCDMETDGGGWTVIQRRGNYGRPEDYFYKNWDFYKSGFGDITQDFWLGNDKILSLTSQKLYTIRFDLKDWEGESRWAVYWEFWISDESSNYTLHVTGYNGTAGDSFLGHHQNMSFTTFDRDNDKKSSDSCAVLYKGGWWYNNCHNSNLNGLYLKGKHCQSSKSVSWYHWLGHEYSLFETEMKIRPLNVTTKIGVPL